MYSKTLACRQLESCIKEVKKTKKVSSNAIKNFRQSIINTHDDPGVGLEEHIYTMWNEYGITDTGRELLLQIDDITLKQAILDPIKKN
ncbi:hypothetical protein PIROE2DRAFT_10666 [Piromyces sp. E2]|nr:hypothetical protein PIROE2DRAFT_10666 [Piromyces sp. E2]|eukprot:OUM62916.1 hypothetical protein PIROE2DRAFT_10666 [Piromyces sp. E2]